MKFFIISSLKLQRPATIPFTIGDASTTATYISEEVTAFTHTAFTPSADLMAPDVPISATTHAPSILSAHLVKPDIPARALNTPVSDSCNPALAVTAVTSAPATPAAPAVLQFCTPTAQAVLDAGTPDIIPADPSASEPTSPRNGSLTIPKLRIFKSNGQYCVTAIWDPTVANIDQLTNAVSTLADFSPLNTSDIVRQDIQCAAADGVITEYENGDAVVDEDSNSWKAHGRLRPRR